MKLTIHRGAHQIGGSCVELNADGARLILDLGLPLVKRDGSPLTWSRTRPALRDLLADGTLPRIRGFYAGDRPSVTALVVSHAHLDHCGLADYVHPDIPVWASEGTRALLEASRLFLPQAPAARRFLALPKWEPTPLGPFTVTGYLVDHSAPDALALLVEGAGSRVFYSGDLRAHGRKAVLFERMLTRPPRDIDCLLLEGTMVGRGKQAYASERDVENALAEVFEAKQNLGLVFCSSQNIDRLVSLYRAARRSSSILVLDLYTAYLLRAMRCISDRLPQFDWEGVRVKYWKSHADCLATGGRKDFLYEARASKIEVGEIVDLRRRVVMLAKSNRLLPIIPRYLPDLGGLELIWSMWPGYLTGEDAVSRFCAKHGLGLRHVHTSGHATVEDLQRLARAIKPQRLVPIHTFEAERFREAFDNVTLVDDGEETSV